MGVGGFLYDGHSGGGGSAFYMIVVWGQRVLCDIQQVHVNVFCMIGEEVIMDFV